MGTQEAAVREDFAPGLAMKPAPRAIGNNGTKPLMTDTANDIVSPEENPSWRMRFIDTDYTSSFVA
jgi:hypothetical protein